MILELGEGLLQRSLSALQSCGRGRQECVVIWLGPRSNPHQVTRVVHPQHTSEKGGYQIDPRWLDELWAELAERDERLVAQVHTHPRQAFHSRTDDRFPIVWKPGLYSLVVPNFAQEPIRQDDWFITQLTEAGTWEQQEWVSE